MKSQPTINHLLKKSLALALVCAISATCATQKQSIKLPEPLVPRDIVDNFLNKTYVQEEKDLIIKDLRNIREICFYKTTPTIGTPTYVATCGGPGACKSTILETYLADKQNFVYVDPDPRSLKFMINTYYQSLTFYMASKTASFQEVLLNAYNKWRDGSNYISSSLLNEAGTNNYNIAHGTTSTSPAVKFLYQNLKRYNYKIILLLCYANDETRVNALDHRAKVQLFIQSCTEDVINKGKMFPERLPTYFEYADELNFYWTWDFAQGSICAATLTKEHGLVVHDQKSFDAFIKKYDEDRMGSQLPAFDELVKKIKPKN